jgi:uncharacterized BrkB/YihY/UPF0761 family membrane protein
VTKRIVALARESATAYTRNLSPQLASAIAYRVLFSLFPLAIFLVSIFGLLIENAERRDELVTWVVERFHLSEAGSVRLDEAIAGLASPSSALGLIALVAVFWGASRMMAAIRVALTSLWGTERRNAWRGRNRLPVPRLPLRRDFLFGAQLAATWPVVNRAARRR